jgi:hypothetical protein
MIRSIRGGPCSRVAHSLGRGAVGDELVVLVVVGMIDEHADPRRFLVYPGVVARLKLVCGFLGKSSQSTLGTI